MAKADLHTTINKVNPIVLVTVLFLTTLILTIVCDWLHLSAEVTKWLMAIGNNFSGSITTLIQLSRNTGGNNDQTTTTSNQNNHSNSAQSGGNGSADNNSGGRFVGRENNLSGGSDGTGNITTGQ